jgi:hypothetical protein
LGSVALKASAARTRSRLSFLSAANYCAPIQQRCLLPVAGQDGAARFADARPIAFKAVEYADDVFVTVFDELLAKTHDVRGGKQRALLRLPGLERTLM